MMARRVWLVLVLIAVVAVGFYWVGFGRGNAPAESGSKIAAAASLKTPPQTDSVAAPSSSNAHRSSSPDSISRKPIHVVAGDGTAAVPSRYQFAGVKRVQTGRDFDDWMSHFSAADQKTLRGFDGRFYGVYKDRNPDQIAWMAAHGYPMPEDVLAAQFIDTSKLRDMAAQGSVKAAFLLQDRELREAAQKMAAQKKYYGQVLSDNPQLRDDADMLRKMISASDSPYRAFMSARNAMILYGTDGSDPVSVDSRVIGALYLAQIMGDSGTTHMINSFIDSASNASARVQRQTVDAGAISLYSRFLKEYRAGSPNGSCMQIFGGNDPYPYAPPQN